MIFGLSLPVLLLAVGLGVLLIALLVYAARVSQPAADGPPGPPTGAAAMERKVATIALTSAAMGALFLGYALREPSRQAEASERLLDTSIGRGIAQYTTLCYSCHGEQGQGAVVPGSNPERVTPPLNRPDLRPTDPDGRKKAYDFVYKTIQRGRPNTPMPAWGTTDGGSLFAEQINDLTLMVLNGDRVVPYEGRRATVWEHVQRIITDEVEQGIVKLPQQPQVENQPFYQALNPAQQAGVRTVLTRGCGGCHVIPNIPGAAGTVGPSLEGVADRKLIAGDRVPNNSVEDLAAWVQDPPGLKPGTPMPNLGLSAEEARNVAEFLYTLKAP